MDSVFSDEVAAAFVVCPRCTLENALDLTSCAVCCFDFEAKAPRSNAVERQEVVGKLARQELVKLAPTKKRSILEMLGHSLRAAFASHWPPSEEQALRRRGARGGASRACLARLCFTAPSAPRATRHGRVKVAPLSPHPCPHCQRRDARRFRRSCFASRARNGRPQIKA